MKHQLGDRRKDQLGGALMAVISLGVILQAGDYRLGTLSRMGPGFFPVALGILLGLVGLGIIATAGRGAEDGGLPVPHAGHGPSGMQWRGWLCIGLGLVLFVVLGTYGGLLPATFAIVFVSALGDRRNSIRDALSLAGAILVVCVVVFHWLLQLQFPLFSWG